MLAPWRTHYRVAKLVGGGGKVLDVGCGPGYLAEELKKKNNYVVGIEVDEASAAAAKAICDEVKVADLEGLAELPYAAGFFDVIVFSDVLEHLARPDLALARLGRYLAAEGKIVAAIPNVAWAPVRLGLLFGRFDYQEKGILDKTHLKIFTLKTFRNLATESGLTVIKEEFTPIPLPLIDNIFSEGKPLYIFHKFIYFLARLVPTLFCFQFILYCKKDAKNI